MRYQVNRAPILKFLSEYGYTAKVYRNIGFLGAFTLFTIETPVGFLHLSVYDRVTERDDDYHCVECYFTRMSKTVIRHITARQYEAKAGYQQIIAVLDSILLDSPSLR